MTLFCPYCGQDVFMSDPDKLPRVFACRHCAGQIRVEVDNSCPVGPTFTTSKGLLVRKPGVLSRPKRKSGAA